MPSSLLAISTVTIPGAIAASLAVVALPAVEGPRYEVVGNGVCDLVTGALYPQPKTVDGLHGVDLVYTITPAPGYTRSTFDLRVDVEVALAGATKPLSLTQTHSTAISAAPFGVASRSLGPIPVGNQHIAGAAIRRVECSKDRRKPNF